MKKKYKLEYTFEDKESFEHAIKGQDYFFALQEISNKFRSIYKYGTEEESLWAEKAREIFYDILKENEIDV